MVSALWCAIESCTASMAYNGIPLVIVRPRCRGLNHSGGTVVAQQQQQQQQEEEEEEEEE